MFTFPISHYASSAEQNFYQDIVDAGLTSGLKLVLDAGSATSYTGSGQDWIDLSGNIGADEFHRGTDDTATTDDPTFNGSSGGLSSSEYWSFDGGDFFEYGAASESWMDDLHQDSALFSILVWYYAIASAGTEGLVSSGNFTAGVDGMNFIENDAEKPRLHVEHSGGDTLNKIADTSVNTSAWNLVGVTVDEPTGAAGGFFYMNGAYNQVSSSDTWDATYSSPGTGAAANRLHIGSMGDEGDRMDNTARIAGVMIWSGAVITKANMDTLWTAQKGRFGL